MTSNRNSAPSGEISGTVVHKVGLALGEITQIREIYAQRLASADSSDKQLAVETEAHTVMVKVLTQQGLSVDQFNEVIAAAKADPDLERRVLEAVKAA